MNITNLEEIPEREVVSPKGKFQLFQKDLSLALGGIKDTGPEGGGHPFDICQVRVPPGKVNWPRHIHTAQWEHYLILSGRGLVRDLEMRETPLKAGDSLLVRPGEVGQLECTGPEDLVYLLIATNQGTDAFSYVDSGKFGVKPWRRFFTLTEVDYYAGEE